MINDHLIIANDAKEHDFNFPRRFTEQTTSVGKTIPTEAGETVQSTPFESNKDLPRVQTGGS